MLKTGTFKKSCIRFKQLCNAKVLITHFIHITYVPNKQDLAKAMRRGAAIICKRNQEGADLLIPILFATGKISVIIIQIKNVKRKYDGGWPDSATTKVTKEYVLGAECLDSNVPYLSIYMNLGARSQSAVRFIASTDTCQAALVVFGIGKVAFPLLLRRELTNLEQTLLLLLENYIDLSKLHKGESRTRALKMLPLTYKC